MAELKNFHDHLIYRELNADEITMTLFKAFERRQVVTDCWRKENGKWVVKSDPFIDDWGEDEYRKLIDCLKNTLKDRGLVYGALADGRLKGFVSVEGARFGSRLQYMDLSSLHVSQDMRRQGIGRKLFLAAVEFAKGKKAQKLYISAHSAVESQAFYKAMGCVEAEEYNSEHVEKEPYDCQLECDVSTADNQACGG